MTGRDYSMPGEIPPGIFDPIARNERGETPEEARLRQERVAAFDKMIERARSEAYAIIDNVPQSYYANSGEPRNLYYLARALDHATAVLERIGDGSGGSSGR